MFDRKPRPQVTGPQPSKPAPAQREAREPTGGALHFRMSTLGHSATEPKTVSAQRRHDFAAVNVHPGESFAAARFDGGERLLPYLTEIQKSFGPAHDLSSVRAHIGGAAAAAAAQLGAKAYASGNRLGFREPPDLRTAAHEAAHVVQQRHRTPVMSDAAGDHGAHESHADAVAERVARGHSARDLLGPESLPRWENASSEALQLKKDDAQFKALEAWREGITTGLSTSVNARTSAAPDSAGVSLTLPAEGIGSLWLNAASPSPPPSIIRVAVILTDGSQVLDSMMTNWYPEAGGNPLNEWYRLQVQSTGKLTAAMAFTDFDNTAFKRSIWTVDVHAPGGRTPPLANPSPGVPPEYLVTGTPSSAGPGGLSFFFAGAGHDREETGYIAGFGKAFAKAGIGGFTDVNVSSGSRSTDITSTLALYGGPSQQTIPAGTAVAAGTTEARAAVSKGQRNLIGYSFGGTVAASVARNLADAGVQVDNLVLLGTPISIQFLRGLQIDPRIKRVIVVNLPGDVIRPGTPPSVLAGTIGIGPGTPSPHFYLAEGDVNQPHREQLARTLYGLGLR